MKSCGFSFALLAAGLLALPCGAAEPLRVVTGEYAPFTGERLPNGGPLTEIARRALAASGFDVHVSFMPWRRGYTQTLEGRQDATFPYGRNAEREQDFFFSESYYTVDRRLYARRGAGINPEDPKTLRGRTYCSPLGYVQFPGMAKRVGTPVQSPPEMASCVKMLMLGRVDFFITTPDIAEAAMAQAEVAAGSFASQSVGKSENYLIVPKKHPRARQIINAFNNGITILKARGEFQQIVRGAKL